MSDTTSLRSVARGGALNLVGALVSALSGFGVVFLVARFSESAAAAGAFLVALALSKIALEVGQLGAGLGLVRAVSQTLRLRRGDELRAALRSAFVPVVIVSVVSGLALVLLAKPLADILTEGAQRHPLRTYLTAFGIFLPAGVGLQLTVNATRGFGTMTPGVVFEYLLRSGGQLLAVGAVFAFGGGAWALGLGYNAPLVVAAIGAMLWLRRLLCEVPSGVVVSRRARRAQFVAFWRFSLPRAVAGGFSVSIQWLDTLLIAALATTADAGIYTAGTRFVVFATFVHAAIVQAIQPIVSSLLAVNDHAGARRLFKIATAWEVMLLWPIHLMVAVFASALLGVLGPEYVAARPTLWILAGAWMIATAAGPVDALLLMGGRSVWSMGNLAVALAVNVVGNLLLVPVLGITGAAVAWMASVLCHNLLPLYEVRRFMRLDPFGPALMTAAALALGCVGGIALGVRLLIGETLVGAGVAVAVAGPLYLLALRAVREPLAIDELVRALRRHSTPRNGAPMVEPSDRGEPRWVHDEACG